MMLVFRILFVICKRISCFFLFCSQVHFQQNLPKFWDAELKRELLFCSNKLFLSAGLTLVPAHPTTAKVRIVNLMNLFQYLQVKFIAFNNGIELSFWLEVAMVSLWQKLRGELIELAELNFFDSFLLTLTPFSSLGPVLDSFQSKAVISRVTKSICLSFNFLFISSNLLVLFSSSRSLSLAFSSLDLSSISFILRLLRRDSISKYQFCLMCSNCSMFITLNDELWSLRCISWKLGLTEGSCCQQAVVTWKIRTHYITSIQVVTFEYNSQLFWTSFGNGQFEVSVAYAVCNSGPGKISVRNLASQQFPENNAETPNITSLGEFGIPYGLGWHPCKRSALRHENWLRVLSSQAQIG